MSLWRRTRPFLSGLVRFLRISYLETQSTYEGTYLGWLWLPLSTLIFSCMLAFVFRHSDVMSMPDFFLYVLSGYVIWGFISDSISGSTDIIQKRFEFAIHNNLSLLGLFGKILVDRLFEFGVNFALLVITVVILHPATFDTNLILFVPFIPLMLMTSLAVSYLVNLLTIAFPDSATLVKTGMRFIFFASPVFWTLTDDTTGVRAHLVRYNPISYYLRLFREIFGLEPISLEAWAITISISLGVTVLALFAYRFTEQYVRNIK